MGKLKNRMFRGMVPIRRFNGFIMFHRTAAVVGCAGVVQMMNAGAVKRV